MFSGIYLMNQTSEIIHIWTIGTLYGIIYFNEIGPQGPCLGAGLEVKI